MVLSLTGSVRRRRAERRREFEEGMIGYDRLSIFKHKCSSQFAKILN